MTDLTPGSAEWARRVSPSKAAAILGWSPWDSPRSMWHKMRGDVPWDEESPAMERGTLCEPAVLGWWRKHHNHTEWAEQVTTTLGDWCVATPDAIADDEMVEAKTAAKMDDWGVPGTDQIPLYYVSQVYVAMHVFDLAGRPVKGCHVPVLGGRQLLFSNYYVPYDADRGAKILARLKAFHDTLDGQAPPLDDSTATYEAVRRVHPDIETGAEVELERDVAVGLLEALADLDECEAQARLAKSYVLDLMGDAQYATHNGVPIARRQKNKSGISFVPLPKNLPLLTEMGIAS